MRIAAESAPHHTQWVRPIRACEDRRHRPRAGSVDRRLNPRQRMRADLETALDAFEAVIEARARYCAPRLPTELPLNAGDAAVAAHLAIERHNARGRVLEAASQARDETTDRPTTRPADPDMEERHG